MLRAECPPCSVVHTTTLAVGAARWVPLADADAGGVGSRRRIDDKARKFAPSPIFTKHYDIVHAEATELEQDEDESLLADPGTTPIIPTSATTLLLTGQYGGDDDFEDDEDGDILTDKRIGPPPNRRFEMSTKQLTSHSERERARLRLLRARRREERGECKLCGAPHPEDPDAEACEVCGAPLVPPEETLDAAMSAVDDVLGLDEASLHDPATGTSALRTLRPGETLSIYRCPYCNAECRPSDRFCYSCDSALPAVATIELDAAGAIVAPVSPARTQANANPPSRDTLNSASDHHYRSGGPGAATAAQRKPKATGPGLELHCPKCNSIVAAGAQCDVCDWAPSGRSQAVTASGAPAAAAAGAQSGPGGPTRECTNCGKDNKWDARFCDWCGFKFPLPVQRIIVCGHCGTENPNGARFCNDCGVPLPAPQDERITAGGGDHSQMMNQALRTMASGSASDPYFEPRSRAGASAVAALSPGRGGVRNEGVAKRGARTTLRSVKEDGKAARVAVTNDGTAQPVSGVVGAGARGHGGAGTGSGRRQREIGTQTTYYYPSATTLKKHEEDGDTTAKRSEGKGAGKSGGKGGKGSGKGSRKPPKAPEVSPGSPGGKFYSAQITHIAQALKAYAKGNEAFRSAVGAPHMGGVVNAKVVHNGDEFVLTVALEDRGTKRTKSKADKSVVVFKDAKNRLGLKKLPGREYTLQALEGGESKFRGKLDEQGVPAKILVKVGAPITITADTAFPDGLQIPAGTTGTIEDCPLLKAGSTIKVSRDKACRIHVRLLGKQFEEKMVAITPIESEVISEEGEADDRADRDGVLYRRLQFPLALAFGKVKSSELGQPSKPGGKGQRALMGYGAPNQHTLDLIDELDKDRGGEGSAALVLAALEEGADANAPNAPDRKRPLYLTVRHGWELAVMRFLVDGGADVNGHVFDQDGRKRIVGPGGSTPLHAAVMCDDTARGLEMARELIQYGAKHDLKNDNKQTPLELATALGPSRRSIKNFLSSVVGGSSLRKMGRSRLS